MYRSVTTICLVFGILVGNASAQSNGGADYLSARCKHRSPHRGRNYPPKRRRDSKRRAILRLWPNRRHPSRVRRATCAEQDRAIRRLLRAAVAALLERILGLGGNMKWVAVAVVCFSLGAFASPALATLSYSPKETSDGGRYLVVEGAIEPDDNLEPFEVAVREHGVSFIVFNSPGGNIVKAIGLGRMIRALKLGTFQPRGLNARRPVPWRFWAAHTASLNRDRLVCINPSSRKRQPE